MLAARPEAAPYHVDGGRAGRPRPAETAKSERLLSLDALRGFDMFFITGGSAMILGLCEVFGSPKCWMAQQMRHVRWEGLAQHDTILPLFLFMMGVSWPFSLASQEAKGRPTWRILLKILTRTALLFLIGLSFYGILKFEPYFRVMGVLQFLALSWGLAATLYVFVRKKWALVSVAAVLLVGYYALLHFNIAPNAPAGASTYAPEWNIIGYWDRAVYPNYMIKGWKTEPQSIFQVPSAVVLALFGIIAGAVLKNREGRSVWRAPAILAAYAAGCGLAGWLFAGGLGDPVIKNLSTASFILVTSAYSFAMLCLFHVIIDVFKLRRWAVIFDPVGKNSILAYSLSMTGILHVVWRFYLSGISKHCGAWAEVVSGLGLYLILWAFLLWLRSRKAFLKV